jgi:hypothetical protein
VESGPGGSRLTADAEHLIAVFLEAENRHRDFLADLEKTLP